MSFIQRELDRMGPLPTDMGNPHPAELSAAQQALHWALEPNGFASPCRMVTGTPEDSEDCLLSLNPAPSGYTSGARSEK
jgi:hypothetical protein